MNSAHSKQKIRLDQYISVVLFVVFLLVIGSVSPISKAAVPEFALVEVAPVPIRVNKTQAQLNLENHDLAYIEADSFHVMDVHSASTLAEKNSNETLYPASTTKMMTALVARDLYKLDQIIEAPAEVLEQGNGMGLIANEKMTVRNLLFGLLIPSGNDAAYTLAQAHPEGLSRFVELMNIKAAELNLTQTHFENPAGFDHDTQVSTARDLALLARELMKDDFLSQVVGTKTMTVTDITGVFSHELVSTNHLLGVEPGMKGIKTGTTWLAGEVLISQTERDGNEIVIALLASEDRFAETKRLIDWVFNNYEWHTIDTSGESL